MKMKNRTLAALAAAIFIFPSCQKDLSLKESDSIQGEVVSSDATIETSPPTWQSFRYNVNSNVAGFWQGVPVKYNSNPSKRYPLIVFIHGIGELGTNLSRMNCCGLPSHMARKTFPANFNVNGVNHSFLVIAPQFKKRPSASQVQSVVDFAKRRWRVDGTRVYVIGLSMGGGSTWDWSAVYGQNAAAIVPVCAGTKPSTSLAAKIAAKNLPIWGLYSTADKVVPAQWGRNFFSWIDARNKNMSGKTKLTMWTDASHNSTWARAFNPKTKVGGYNIYQWLLLNKRGGGSSAPAPSSPAPSSGNKAPVAKGSVNRTTVYLSDGIDRVTLNGKGSYDSDGSIARYSWTKLSGPSTKLHTFGAGLTYAAHLQEGTYVFKLTVTDSRGAVGSSTVTVKVYRKRGSGTSSSSPKPSTGNKVPIARGGADRTIYLSSTNQVTLDGLSSYDPDGKIYSYNWTMTYGPSYVRRDIANGKLVATQLKRGKYTFRLTVKDNKGASGIDYVYVTVK